MFARFASTFKVGLFALMVFFILARGGAVGGPTERVLILNSYHLGMQWSDTILRGIDSILPADLQRTVEFMDAKGHTEPEYFDLLHQLIRHKYRNQHFDVIISTDNDAFQFLSRYHDEIFPGTPVIFCGVTGFTNAKVAGRPYMTGIVETLNRLGSIKLALMLHPSARRVFVITDNSTTGIANREEIQRLARADRIRAEVVFLDDGHGLDQEELLDRLKKVPPDSVVLFSDYFRDRKNHYVDYREFLPRLSAASRAPIYSSSDIYLGCGIVGGRLNSAFYQGVAVAEMAMKVLHGTPVAQIPIQREGFLKYMFDDRELRRWDIPHSALPLGSILINQPVSFYRQHSKIIWRFIGLFILEALVILALALNIKRRRRAELALRASESQYRLLFDAIPQIVWSAHPDGTNDFCNRRWLDYCGLSLEASIAGGWSQMLHPDEQERIVQAQAQAIAQGQPYSMEQRYRRTDGVYRWHYVQMTPLRNERGEVNKWIGTAMDIDDRKRAEQALRDASRRKDEFLAMLAHELRNPLAPIRNAIQVLRLTARDNPRLQRQSDLIDRQVTHMARLLDDLLDVSRLTRGMTRLHIERLDLRVVIDQAIETIQSEVEMRGLTLSCECPDRPLLLDGDPIRLAQILYNLLKNAVKFTDPGGHISLDVTCEAAEPGAAPDTGARLAVLNVRDTGIGIEPDVLPHVFELFTQADKSLDRSVGGLGIGLTMVSSLVKLHGGSIEAHSEGLGHGSQFTIRLPILGPFASAAPDHLGPVVRFVSLDGLASPATDAAPPVRRLKILVVDDIHDAAQSMAELLALWDYQTAIASDGFQALDQAREDHPDVVLLDIGLPRINGYEVVRRLRGELGLAQALIIAITGYGADTDRHEAEQAGFDCLLTKPVDLPALRQMLERRSETMKVLT